MDKFTNKAWQQYEAGKEYKRRIGLYETVSRNEAFTAEISGKAVRAEICQSRYSTLFAECSIILYARWLQRISLLNFRTKISPLPTEKRSARQLSPQPTRFLKTPLTVGKRTE